MGCSSMLVWEFGAPPGGGGLRPQGAATSEQPGSLGGEGGQGVAGCVWFLFALGVPLTITVSAEWQRSSGAPSRPEKWGPGERVRVATPLSLGHSSDSGAELPIGAPTAQSPSHGGEDTGGARLRVPGGFLPVLHPTHSSEGQAQWLCPPGGLGALRPPFLEVEVGAEAAGERGPWTPPTPLGLRAWLAPRAGEGRGDPGRSRSRAWVARS